MTKTEAARLVAFLLGAYSSVPVSSKTTLVYEAQLADLEFSTARRAVDRLTKTSRFMPTIAEIRAMAVEIQHGPRRLGAEAWGDVLGEIRRVGLYGLPRFDDPRVAEAVHLMTWRGLCLGENEAADRARFVDLYDGLQDRARADAVAGATLPAARGLLAGDRATGPQLLGQLLPKKGNKS